MTTEKVDLSVQIAIVVVLIVLQTLSEMKERMLCFLQVFHCTL